MVVSTNMQITEEKRKRPMKNIKGCQTSSSKGTANREVFKSRGPGVRLPMFISWLHILRQIIQHLWAPHLSLRIISNS